MLFPFLEFLRMTKGTNIWLLVMLPQNNFVTNEKLIEYMNQGSLQQLIQRQKTNLSVTELLGM